MDGDTTLQVRGYTIHFLVFDEFCSIKDSIGVMDAFYKTTKVEDTVWIEATTLDGTLIFTYFGDGISIEDGYEEILRKYIPDFSKIHIY